MSSFLEDAVEDAIVAMAEQNIALPSAISVYFTPKEWEAVERFHRLKIRSDGKLGISKDRWPFVVLKVLGISVRLSPEPTEMSFIH